MEYILSLICFYVCSNQPAHSECPQLNSKFEVIHFVAGLPDRSNILSEIAWRPPNDYKVDLQSLANELET